jgi:porphobilinogen synthase
MPFVRSRLLTCPENDRDARCGFDPYSIYGHDGIIANSDVENDTNDALVKWQFLMHKQSRF